MADSIDFIKKIPIFSQLSSEALANIVKLQNIKNYKKGIIIFHEGDAGDAFFFVKTGKVKIFKTSFDGRDITLNILGEGSIFAEVTLFNDIDYPATVEVLEDSEIGVILNKDIEKLILQNNELALEIIKILNKRLFRSQTAVKDMAFSDTYIRITKTLIDLCKRHGTTTENGIEIDASITRQDIANMVGTSRETVSRVVSALKKEGLILTNSKKIIIIDINKLQDR
ncbi:Crp/Fnr family transcriptional regulator [Clostridium akagii]|uniref:Crp/Fnr family transcriptional regulator n=1 Tax=Clostridium akagii TaxID=91623 RepID=UPI00047E706E|nr:Crp/Fnr family transcriptional regulator [Clostridium akagii]